MLFSATNVRSPSNKFATHYWKIDDPAKRKPKHPVKVYVWASISRLGATKICIFESIMDADLYCNILESTLIPFLCNTLPDHQFMQENDPKHTSIIAKAISEDNGINCRRTPLESPDAIGALKHIRPFISESSALQIYQALILPHFDYCSSVWDELNVTLSDKLQNRAARVITRSSYDTSISFLQKRLHWDNLSTH